MRHPGYIDRKKHENLIGWKGLNQEPLTANSEIAAASKRVSWSRQQTLSSAERNANRRLAFANAGFLQGHLRRQSEARGERH